MIAFWTLSRPAPGATPAWAPRHLGGLLGIAFLAWAAILGGGWPAHTAQAQAAVPTQRIAAVVNEDAVSLYDLNVRIDIVMATGGMPNSPEIRQRLAPQILRALIDETLKIQEAKRAGVTVSTEDINGGIERLERQNKLPPGGLEKAFKAAGLDQQSLVHQIRAELGWIKAVQSTLGPRVNVSEDEISLYQQNLQRNLGKPEYLVADIFLPVDNAAQDAEVLTAAQRMIEQMRLGANFAALAQQFSRGPAAQRGGDLGWVGPGEIDAEVLQALGAMAPGNLSQPIRTFGGYHILLLRDQRIASGGASSLLKMSRVVIPLRGSRMPTPERLADLRQRIAATRSCEAFDALAGEVGPPSGSMGSIDPARLPPEAQAAIRDLPAGQPSAPLTMDNAEIRLMICDRPTGGLPGRDILRERLIEQKLQNLAQRRLRDLRQQAIIDIRV